MADGTVDNLNIQISVDSQKAERSLDNLAKAMDRVRKSFSAIDTTQFKNLCASSGEFVKSLNKIKTSTKA